MVDLMPVRIQTPFPTIDMTAKELGVSKSRVRWLTALMDGIVAGKADLSGRAGKAAARKFPGNRRSSSAKVLAKCR